MDKIPTIFERDAAGRLRNEYVVAVSYLKTAAATEKLDGVNVRLTVRSGELVRLEKRRNPAPAQKANGIITPWYTDAHADDPADKHIYVAAAGTDLANVPDGEWSGEAVGPGLQGNPLDLAEPTVMLFSLGRAPVFTNVPIGFVGLRDWFATKPASKFGNGPIEGIVWRDSTGRMAKIKARDFRRIADEPAAQA